jgi:hypothetical protein
MSERESGRRDDRREHAVNVINIVLLLSLLVAAGVAVAAVQQHHR